MFQRNAHAMLAILFLVPVVGCFVGIGALVHLGVSPPPTEAIGAEQAAAAPLEERDRRTKEVQRLLEEARNSKTASHSAGPARRRARGRPPRRRARRMASAMRSTGSRRRSPGLKPSLPAHVSRWPRQETPELPRERIPRRGAPLGAGMWAKGSGRCPPDCGPESRSGSIPCSSSA